VQLFPQVFPQGFTHWTSPRLFLNRHRRRIHTMLGAE
jgi:hypothetical protein